MKFQRQRVSLQRPEVRSARLALAALAAASAAASMPMQAASAAAVRQATAEQVHADQAANIPGKDNSRPWLSVEALRSKYADRSAHFLNVQGLQVYYTDEGTGPAILMVHGSASSLKTYDKVVLPLRKHYRVIRYDVPGQGLSGAVSEEAANQLQPEAVAEALLSELGLTKVTAVGVSSGGTLCMYLAARRPDLVQRLVLANTPADPVDASHLKQPQAFQDAQREARETHFQSQTFWDLFLSYFAGEPERMTASIREQYYDFNRRIPDKNALSLVAKVADHARAVAAMAAITAPTLLVWGARDPLLTPDAAESLARYLPHASVSKLLLPDVGHFPPLEVPERFAAIVADYIESVTPVTPRSPPPEDR